MECAFGNTIISVIKCPDFDQYPVLSEKKVLVLGGKKKKKYLWMKEHQVCKLLGGSGGEVVHKKKVQTCNTNVAKC